MFHLKFKEFIYGVEFNRDAVSAAGLWEDFVQQAIELHQVQSESDLEDVEDFSWQTLCGPFARAYGLKIDLSCWKREGLNEDLIAIPVDGIAPEWTEVFTPYRGIIESLNEIDKILAEDEAEPSAETPDMETVTEDTAEPVAEPVVESGQASEPEADAEQPVSE